MNDFAGNLFSIHPLHAAALDTLRIQDQPDQLASIERMERLAERQRLNPNSQSMRLEDLPVTLNGSVAIIDVKGIIIKRHSWYFASHLALQATFKQLSQMPEVRAAIVRFDTPGGMIAGAAETCDAMDAFKASGRLLVGQSVGLCASMGMHLASHCDELYAQRMDTIGSIGSKTMLYDYSGWMAEQKVRPVAIDTGEFKSLGGFGLEITPEHEAFLQSYINDLQADFRSSLQTGRSLTDEEYTTVADGRFWLASDAESLKLIDGIRTFDETLAAVVASVSNRPPTGNTTVSQDNNGVDSDAEAIDTDSEKKTADKKSDKTDGEKKSDKKTADKKTSEAPEPTGERKELARFMTAFGDAAGAQYFAEGVDFADALAQEHQKLRTENAELKNGAASTEHNAAQAAALLGEDEPVGTSGGTSGKQTGDTAGKGLAAAVKIAGRP